MKTLLTIVCMVFAAQVGANTNVVATNVQFLQDKSFHLKMEFVVDAPMDRIHAVLTDYDNLAHLNPSIISSQQLQSPDPEKNRVETVTKDCVLFFCKTIRRVEDVSSPSKQRINSVIVPELSDFSSGVAAWTLTTVQGSTKVLYEAVLQPKFATPAVGTGTIQKRLRTRLMQSAAKINEIVSIHPLS